MIVYLAGEHPVKNGKAAQHTNAYILESFFYAKSNKHFESAIKRAKNVILDSGAFSFFGGGKKVNWNQYVQQYVDFINKHQINLFLELDLYAVIGVEKTEGIRAAIEKGTNKKSIPVFHKSLGIDYFKKMCENYNYIAISASGMYESKWTRKHPQKLKAMVDYANSQGVKVHGLGYTKIEMLKQIKFHSIDSTAWLYGNRGGFLYFFNGVGLRKVLKPEGMRMKSAIVAQHNFNEWLKFQKYANESL